MTATATHPLAPPRPAVGWALDGESVDWPRGACWRDDRPDDWIEEDGDTARARQVCHGCPIATECLAYALLADEELGLWGGLDPMERDDYRRKLMQLLGPDDPVVRFLRRRVTHRRRLLCPRCAAYRMQPDDDMCRMCAAELDELDRLRKREYWHRMQQVPKAVAPVDRAAVWLRMQLQRGPQPSATLKARAADVGITARTLARARTDLDVAVRRKAAPDGGSMWALPKHRHRLHQDGT